MKGKIIALLSFAIFMIQFENQENSVPVTLITEHELKSLDANKLPFESGKTDLEKAYLLFVENIHNTPNSAFSILVYEIYSDGLLPNLRLLDKEEVSSFLLTEDYLADNVLEEILPTINCDGETYFNKTGTFINIENDLLIVP